MSNGHDRRRFLQIAGTGAAASLAGCSEMGFLSDDDSSDHLLTVAVGPDQDEIDDLIDDVESGEVDQMEAQQREQELIESAVSDFQERAEDDDDLTIEGSTEEVGLFQVDAEGELLIDLLRGGEVDSIHTGQAYDQFLEQQEQQQQQQEEAPEEIIEEEDPDGDEDDGDGDDGDEEADGDGDDGDEESDE